MEIKKDGMPQPNEQIVEEKEWKPTRRINIDLSSGMYLSFDPDGTITEVIEPGEENPSQMSGKITKSEALKKLREQGEARARQGIERAEEELQYAQNHLDRKKQTLDDLSHLIEYLSKS